MIYFIHFSAIIFSLTGALQDKSILSIHCRWKSINQAHHKFSSACFVDFKELYSYIWVLAASLSNMFCHSSYMNLWTNFMLTQQKHVRLAHDCQEVYCAELCPLNFTTAKWNRTYPTHVTYLCPSGRRILETTTGYYICLPFPYSLWWKLWITNF